MRRLLVLIVAAAVLWAGWWIIGARALETGLSRWIKERRAEGWQAEYTDLNVAGFPNRFDTTFTDLRLADPDTGLAWQAPFFQILSLSYQPNHVIAVWPDRQLFASPSEKITVTSGKMQASAVFQPNTALALDRTSFVMEDFKLVSDTGWRAEFPSAKLASRLVPLRENAHEIAFEATEMRPSADWVASLGVTGLPDVFQTLRLKAEISFDAPWDRSAIEEFRPQITAVDLSMLEAHWGELHLQAAGELSVDSGGLPKGQLTLRATNWREILQVAVASGALPGGLGSTLESGFDILAGLSGNRKTLDIPLDFRDGRVSLGPLPLGPAPRLLIR